MLNDHIDTASNASSSSTATERDKSSQERRNNSRYGSNVKNFENEWKELLLMGSEDNLTELKKISISGGFKKFRSICWSLLLGDLLPRIPPQSWVDQRRKNRFQYETIRKNYMLDPRENLEGSNDDPLSQEKSSAWNQHFRDTELRNLIQQDVMRTNPNIQFYRQDFIQNIMINILFCFARENPLICYRQGMHEILAPLIFVIYGDHVCVDHIREEANAELDRDLVEMLDSKYLEADSYSLFCRVMESLELFYRINNTNISETGQMIYNQDSDDAQRKRSEIEVVHQLNIIKDKIFAKQDTTLHNHLLKLEIPLAIFGIRWLRLLFGREFNLHDLLILWDAIFGIGDNLALTYYIVVAMLIHIRNELLTRDYTDCLTLLMKFPRSDISIIIRHALHMKSPIEFELPPNVFSHVTSMNQSRIRNSPRRTPNISKKAPPSLAVYKKSSFDKPSDFYRQRNKDEVVDGYLIDDPEVLKVELHDAHNIIEVTRLKLLQYLSVFRKHFPDNKTDELYQTLDGIEELCALLNMKKNSFGIEVKEDIPIDPAFEPDDNDTLKGNMFEPRPFPFTYSSNSTAKAASTKYEQPSPKSRVNNNLPPLLKRNSKEIEMNLIRSSEVGWSELCSYPPTSIPFETNEKEDILHAEESMENMEDD